MTREHEEMIQPPSSFLRAQNISHPPYMQRQKIEGHDLSDERFGGSHADFRPGMDRQRRPGSPGKA